MDHPFRSAAFGGFNRQDVLDYLEKTAAENARKQQELQRRLEEAEEDRRKLASQESDQEERVTILNRDRESLSQQLEQVKAVLEASREREEAQSRELEELRRENLADRMRQLCAVDVLVDGPFLVARKSYAALFRGSDNQRLIDLGRTRASGRMTLWTRPDALGHFVIPES